MKDEDILTVLDTWNFWKHDPDTGISREFYVNRITSLISETEIPVVIETGIRRSGKSFIAKQSARRLISNGFPKERVLIINLEDERLIERNYRLLLEMYRAYREKINPDKSAIIIIDEAQEVDGWERFVRGLAEKGEAKFIITGSSSKLLDSEYSTLLSGRHVSVYVHPLDLLEYRDFSKRPDPFSCILMEGSFPAIVLSDHKSDLTGSYFETIVLKDVIKRFRIQKQEILIRLAKFYITSVGSGITFNSVSKFLNIPVKTAYNFSIYLEKSYLIFFTERFSFSVRKQINSPRKVYAIDNSFPSFLGINPIEIRGRLLENAIGTILYFISRQVHDFHFYFWNENNKEVDFIIKHKREYEAIQVSYSIEDEKTRIREIDALLDCANRLNLSKVEIITMGYTNEELVNDISIRYVSAPDWIEQRLVQYKLN